MRSSKLCCCLVLVLFALGGVHFLHGQADTTAPVLVSFGFSPQQVDTGSAAANLTFSAHVADDLSGVVDVYVDTVSPSGTQGQYSSSGVPVSGSALDGIFQVPLNYPIHSEVGTWTVAYVTVRDKVGNYRMYYTADLQAAGFPTTFMMTGSQDTMAPNLVSFDFSPQQVDTGSAAANLTFSAHVTDDLSGVVDVYVDTVSPSGTQGQYSSSGVPVSGSALDGIFQVPLNYPIHSEVGTWTVAYVTVRDKVGNYRMYYTADLQAAGFLTTFMMTGGQDTTAPTLVSFAFSPQQVNTGSGAANVVFSAHVSDNLSGVVDVYVDTVSPSGKQGQYSSSGVPVSGSALDGIFQVVISYPKYSEVGTWTVAYVTVRDKVGNYRMYYTADLQAAGFPTSITNLVTSPYKAYVRPPLNADDSSVFSAKRGVIPVKFTLTSDDLPTCGLPEATISLSRTAGSVVGSIGESTYLASSDSGSDFRIDPTACQYIYNLAVSTLGVGTYRVNININGIAVGHAVFALK